MQKNKKLLTYPYCYIVMSNGVGTANTYRQEVWSLNSNNKINPYVNSIKSKKQCHPVSQN